MYSDLIFTVEIIKKCNHELKYTTKGTTTGSFSYSIFGDQRINKFQLKITRFVFYMGIWQPSVKRSPAFITLCDLGHTVASRRLVSEGRNSIWRLKCCKIHFNVSLHSCFMKHWGLVINFPSMARERVCLFATDRGLLWETGMHVGKTQKTSADDNGTRFQEICSHKRCTQWPHAASKQAATPPLKIHTACVVCLQSQLSLHPYPPPFDPFTPTNDLPTMINPSNTHCAPVLVCCWLENEFHTSSERNGYSRGVSSVFRSKVRGQADGKPL